MRCCGGVGIRQWRTSRAGRSGPEPGLTSKLSREAAFAHQGADVRVSAKNLHPGCEGVCGLKPRAPAGLFIGRAA